MRELLEPLGAAGNLVNDAHLAALAIEHGAELNSLDSDFSRFSGLRWINPSTPLYEWPPACADVKEHAAAMRPK